MSLLWEQGVAGSNPATPTQRKASVIAGFFLYTLPLPKTINIKRIPTLLKNMRKIDAIAHFLTLQNFTQISPRNLAQTKHVIQHFSVGIPHTAPVTLDIYVKQTLVGT